jgi:hypothetical protein
MPALYPGGRKARPYETLPCMLVGAGFIPARTERQIAPPFFVFVEVVHLGLCYAAAYSANLFKKVK